MAVDKSSSLGNTEFPRREGLRQRPWPPSSLTHCWSAWSCPSLYLRCLSLANPSLSPQLLEVNKQWDQHFRSMKQQYEQKVLGGYGNPGL